jgi:hypothetical protein
MAVTQAVERFETKRTERLVKDEYEVIALGAERDDMTAAAEDDFEIIVGI